MRVLYIAVLLLSGCSTHAVRCDAHLSPINQPRPPATPVPGTGALP